MILNRWARQDTYKTMKCTCGVHDHSLGLKIHSPKCARVMAMENLLKMINDGTIIETHSFPSNAGAGRNWERKHQRFQISKTDRKLGYWVKDVETGRWLLENVERAIVAGKIVPITVLKEEEKKHG